MDPLSIAASVAGIIGLTGQTLKVTNILVHDARHGREAAAEFHNELSILHDNLARLDSFLRSESGALKFQDTSVLVSSSFAYRGRLESLQRKLDNARKSRLTLLKWPLNNVEHRQTIEELRAYAQCVQFSLSVNGCALLSKTSNEVVEVLRNQLQAFQLLETFSSQTSSSTNALAKQAQIIQDHQATKERSTILEWISPVKHEQKQHNVAQPRVQGTGGWFLMLDQFTRWRDGLDAGIAVLLCQGIQGSGKSVIASLVIDHLRDRLANRNEAVAYVFCNYKEHDDQSADQMLSSLLKQLAVSSNNIHPPVKELYQKLKDQDRRPQMQDLEQTVLHQCDMYDRVFIVVDALDECGAQDKRALLNSLAKIRGKPSASIMITSRSFPENVSELFTNARRISIGAHKADLEKYILQEIESSDNIDIMDEQLRHDIIDRISSGAHGMFLLAALQVRAVLDGVSAGDMEEALARLPTALEGAFEETLKRIQDQAEARKKLGMETLMWISHARRPLLMDELVDALAIKPSERSLNPRNRPSKRLILESCHGLVALDEESSVVRLVHYSVQEYLFDHQSRLFPSGEGAVAEKCLRYLLLNPSATGSHANETAIQLYAESFPFCRYACRYWGDHVRSAADESIKRLAVEFLQSQPHVARSCQMSQWVLGRKEVYWRAEEGNSCTGLHLACGFGLQQIAKEILDTTDIGINVRTEMGTTALIKAAAGGHEGCVRMLIERGADLKQENWYGTALHCAAEAGETPSISALLSTTFDVDFKASDGRTALQCAVASGQLQALQCLLSHGADVDAGDDQGNSPLRTSILRDQSTDMVQVLLENGASTEVMSNEGVTVLHEACALGKPEVVKLLLKHGANIHSTYDTGFTALHLAAGMDNMNLLDILLEHGAHVDATRDDFVTPLALAARQGCAASVRKLLEWGADPNVGDYEGFTPLHFATLQGREDIVSHLLFAGADIDAKNHEGLSILALADGQNDTSVVARLVALVDRTQDAIDSIAKKDKIQDVYMCAQCGHAFEDSMLLV